jgi:phosphopantetheinyl transferase
MILLTKIITIKELKQRYGWDDTLSYSANRSLVSNKWLIDILKQEGYSFDFTIERESKGKPYFLHNNNLHFSISDTKDYVAIVLSNRRVGIDIEYLRKGKRAVAERFFHPLENTYLTNQATSLQDFAFSQLWTIKEAYVKMTGTGIANNFSTIDLSPNEYLPSQDYYKNSHHILSSFSPSMSLFTSICEW